MEPKSYKVVKVFRVSTRRKVLKKNLSLDAARSLVKSYPDSNRSMVVYTVQK